MWYIWQLPIITLPLKWAIDKLLSPGACWVQVGSTRSQVNLCQARLLLSSLCLILKLKFTCLIVLHLRLSLHVFVWNSQHWKGQVFGVTHVLGVSCQLQKTSRGLGYNITLNTTNSQVLWPEETIMIIYFDLLQAKKYLLLFLKRSILLNLTNT